MTLNNYDESKLSPTPFVKGDIIRVTHYIEGGPGHDYVDGIYEILKVYPGSLVWHGDPFIYVIGFVNTSPVFACAEQLELMFSV
jgi:hypothetical protein